MSRATKALSLYKLDKNMEKLDEFRPSECND